MSMEWMFCWKVLQFVELSFLIFGADGAKKIRDNDLTQDIEYTGEIEFENVCSAFNDMQECGLPL